VSEPARELLRELLAEALAGANGNGEPVIPQVPPPPVAAVHRPGEHKGVRPLEGGRGLERVAIATDEDLNRFVHALLARPDREAILAGRVRFTLGAGAEAPAGVVRVDRGAVTERKVAEAAKAGARLVLGPAAVLTPLAREKARALGLEIERE
jgi:hypothetical protein